MGKNGESRCRPCAPAARRPARSGRQRASGWLPHAPERVTTSQDVQRRPHRHRGPPAAAATAAHRTHAPLPAAAFLTPKAIANRIKAKGLQKLRWYCQVRRPGSAETCTLVAGNRSGWPAASPLCLPLTALPPRRCARSSAATRTASSATSARRGTSGRWRSLGRTRTASWRGAPLPAAMQLCARTEAPRWRHSSGLPHPHACPAASLLLPLPSTLTACISCFPTLLQVQRGV